MIWSASKRLSFRSKNVNPQRFGADKDNGSCATFRPDLFSCRPVCFNQPHLLRKLGARYS